MVRTRVWHRVFLTALLLTGATAAAATTPASSVTEVKITYVGNAGFLIEAGGKKVIVDALYRVGVPGHVVLSKQVQSMAETAQPPFDGVGLVLATHVHNDHFDGNAVGRHLLANRAATFVTTPQTLTRMQEVFPGFAAVTERVRGIYPKEGEKLAVDVEGYGLRVLALHHGRTTPFQNIGFLLDIDGAKLLHVGDTEASHPELGRYALPAEQIDVAFIPFWYLLDEQGVRTIREAVAAHTIVPMHIPPPGAPSALFGAAHDREGALKRLREIENVLIFEREMETKVVALD